MIERVEPPPAADETTTLCTFLDYFRASLLLKAEGLTDAQGLMASVPPSDLCLTGLIRHMSEVERNWFQRWFMGAEAPPLYYGDHDRDGDFHPAPDVTLAESIEVFGREVNVSRHVAAAASLDDLSVKVDTNPDRPGFQPSMRWILVHMIEEYARHVGHADLIRERIDGATGD